MLRHIIFDVAVYFSMLQYMFFRCCSACFSMLQSIFFQCCSTYFFVVIVHVFNVAVHIFFSYCNIYNPILHYIVFLYVFAMSQLKRLLLFWDRGTVRKRGVSENGGQGCGGRRRKGWVPFLFHGRRDGFRAGLTFGRTHAPDVGSGR
jgi:hypothetical protein